MISFIRNMFKNKKGINYELVDTKIEKEQDNGSDMFRIVKIDNYIDKNEKKGNKIIRIATILVKDDVSFEVASSTSNSFKMDRNTIRGRHLNLDSRKEATRTTVYSWEFADGSYITESVKRSHEFKGKPFTEIYPDFFKQNMQNNTKDSPDGNLDMVVKENTSGLREPELVIMFGPPGDEGQKIMYQKYQESRKNERTEEYLAWESLEKHMVDFLFTRKNNLPSPIEEMFFKLLNVPTKIESYKFGMGFHKDKWVASATIPASSVLFANNPNMQWPPNAEIIKTSASFIGYILTREWIYVFSIIPK